MNDFEDRGRLKNESVAGIPDCLYNLQIDFHDLVVIAKSLYEDHKQEQADKKEKLAAKEREFTVDRDAAKEVERWVSTGRRLLKDKDL